MKVEILFPEVGNLCGDLMNIRYLRQCCPELEVVETDLKSRPAFLEGGVDLVYMGSATEKGLELMVKALTPYREELAALPGYALWNELPDGMGDYFAFILDSEKKDETQGDFGSLWLKGENT